MHRQGQAGSSNTRSHMLNIELYISKDGINGKRLIVANDTAVAVTTGGLGVRNSSESSFGVYCTSSAASIHTINFKMYSPSVYFTNGQIAVYGIKA